MAPGRRRDEQKERQWRRWIDLWQDSGSSVADFCARHGLSTATFYAWRKTLHQRDQQRLSFLPVHIVDDPAPPAACPIELLLPDGRLLRLRPGFDAPTLRRLLELLAGQPPC
jgi:transposase